MKTFTKKLVTQMSYDITGFAIKVHRSLGPGLLESVYEKCLAYELNLNGFTVSQQVRIPIIYGEIRLQTDLYLDLLVNDCVIVELKTVTELLPVHEAQLLTYMRLLKKPQGLLFNFYTDNISRSMKPLVNEHFNKLPDE